MQEFTAIGMEAIIPAPAVARADFLINVLLFVIIKFI
jgi:hypothetical protein